VLLTITAATVKPVQMVFESAMSERDIRAAVDAAIAPELYLDDVHGSPKHRRHLTYHFAQDICEELFG
jgi:hypothetical protein